ncbi:MAG: biopolymer transporter ExbD [Sedimentisphaerales bacterium]|nr:biopolymer transporter ExbD [Sedimentisphaerales bacterium]
MIPPGKIEDSILEDIENNKKSFANLCLRLTPLIDVIFLLLIFFFISAQFRPAESVLPLGLPAAHAESAATIIEPLTINILSTPAGCRIQIGDISTDITADNAEENLADFVETFASILKRQKRVLSDPVILVFDDEVQWDYTAKIYNLLYGLGVNDLTFRLNIESR